MLLLTLVLYLNFFKYVPLSSINVCHFKGNMIIPLSQKPFSLLANNSEERFLEASLKTSSSPVNTSQANQSLYTGEYGIHLMYDL